MDVLPEPTDATPFLTRIPYLARYAWYLWHSWHVERFLNFPLECGFVDHAGRFEPEQEDQDSNTASMLQAWLFFGVLAKFVGRTFKVQDFVKQDELGQDVITLAPLKKCRIPEIEPDLIRPLKVEMEMLLDIVDFRPSSVAHLPHVFEIWHSILWLWEVLDIRLSTDDLRISREEAAFGDFDIPMDPFQRASLSQLDRSQWCPFNRRRLLSLQTCTLRYVTSIPRQSFPPFLTHRSCSENACTGNATDVETFHTRHVNENCSCSFIDVSPSELASICRQGSIPLIEIRPSGSHSQNSRDPEELYTSSPSIEISLQSWTPSTSFTAISHVWSHGLGNQQSNSLPICQLKKLALAVEQALDSRKRPQLIWMDVLCIPVLEEYKDERRTSINKMGVIYAAAETVLVLDYELQRIPIKNLDRLQVLAHLFTCSWMERAWTYNEGSLSRSCCFQFADKIFDTKRIHDVDDERKPLTDFSKSLRLLLEIDLANHCVAEFRRRMSQYSFGNSKIPIHARSNYTFINAWNALGGRSTTKPEDLVVILANLRGISLSHLSRFRPEEKLAVLLSYQRLIPFNFLTSPNHSQYSCLSEPDRWIPRTFDGSYISRDYLLHQTPLDDGLELNCLHSKAPKRPQFLDLFMLPLGQDSPSDRDIQICWNGLKSRYRVKFLREFYPPLDHNPSMKFLVVEKGEDLGIKPNEPMKGCCLQLPDSIHLSRDKLEQSGELCRSLFKYLSKYNEKLRFIYDCPIRLELQEDLSLLSGLRTPCQPDEAHKVPKPWTIIIESNVSKYRERTACRGDFSYSMEAALFEPGEWLIMIGIFSNIALAIDLGIECIGLISNVEEQVLDWARYQHCSEAAIAVILGCYIWPFANLLPDSYKSQLRLDKKQHVLKLLVAAHGLIADIFIFSFSFILYIASRPGVARLTLLTVNVLINILTLVYYALHQIFARYLMTVWLATFQDDWSSKTHNRRWWILFKCFGGSTPDTSF